MIKLSAAQLWVHDQDEALAFYTDKLGFEVRQPTRPCPSWATSAGSRSARAGQPDIAIVLMAIPGPAGDGRRDGRAGADADGEGLRRNGVPRRPTTASAAYEELKRSRRRVRRRAGGAPVRRRRVLPRPVGQPHPADAGARARGRLARADPTHARARGGASRSCATLRLPTPGRRVFRPSRARACA